MVGYSRLMGRDESGTASRPRVYVTPAAKSEVDLAVQLMMGSAFANHRITPQQYTHKLQAFGGLHDC